MFSQTRKISENIIEKKWLRTFCRKFLKIWGKIFWNIWNYLTNISIKFSDFLLGWWGEENFEKIRRCSFKETSMEFGG